MSSDELFKCAVDAVELNEELVDYQKQMSEESKVLTNLCENLQLSVDKVKDKAQGAINKNKK